MASFKDAQWMIDRCIQLSMRPDQDEKMTRAKWASLLTLGQEHWFPILCTHVPEAQWGAPAELTVSADNKTASFPADVVPLGKVVLYDGPNGRQLRPGPYNDPGADFSIEYDAATEAPIIRAPLGRTFAWGNGFWGRWADAGNLQITVDAAGTATTREPVIHPRLRQAVVYHALALEASMGGYGDPAYWEHLEIKEAWDDPNTGKLGAITTLKTQFQDQGANSGAAHVWWKSPDLGNLRHRLV